MLLRIEYMSQNDDFPNHDVNYTACMLFYESTEQILTLFASLYIIQKETLNFFPAATSLSGITNVFSFSLDEYYAHWSN